MLLVTENLVTAAETETSIERQKGCIKTKTEMPRRQGQWWPISGFFPERTAQRPNPKKNMVYRTIRQS